MFSINKYNSIILSIFGTLGIVVLIIFIIVLLKDSFKNNQHNIQSQEMISEQSAKKLLDFDKHKQLISFDEPPICIDSTNEIYIYAINQKTLLKPEKIIIQDCYDARGGMPMGRGTRKVKEIATLSGNFNNIIIYDALNNKTDILFKRRISISRCSVYFDSLNSKNTIVMLGNSKDTDNDGFLTASDLKALFIYDIDRTTMDSIEIGDATLLDYQILGNSNKITLRIGLDKNADGRYDYEHEPSIVKTYSLDTKKTKFLLDSELSEKIQNMVDGKKVKF